MARLTYIPVAIVIGFVLSTHSLSAQSASGSHPRDAGSLAEMGNWFLDSAQYDSALYYYGQALTYNGDDQAGRRLAYKGMGEVYQLLGEYEKSIQMYHEVLSLQAKTIPIDDAGMAETHNSLGILYFGLGDYAKAQRNFQGALESNIKAFGENHILVAKANKNLGDLADELGNYALALSHYERAQDIQLMYMDKRDPKMVKLYNSMGLLKRNMGNLEEALEYFTDALNIWQKSVGDDHPDCASFSHNIGTVYELKGDDERARSFYERALVIRTQHWGPSHPDLAHEYNGLGNIYTHLGDYGKAVQYYQEALTVRENHWGQVHISLAEILENLGNAYDLLGEKGTARSFLERALDLKRNHFGNAHPSIARSYNNLGVFYENSGDVKQAISYHQQAIAIYEQSFGKDHPSVANSYHNLGISYQRNGNADAALQALRKGLDLKIRNVGPSHPLVSDFYREIGTVYEQNGRYEPALSYYQQSLESVFPQLDQKDIQKNPVNLKSIDRLRGVKALHAKASALKNMGNKSGSILDHQLSLETYLLAMDHLDTLRINYAKEASKQLLLDASFQLYHGAMEVASALWQATQDQQYFELAFHICEKSKAALLRDNLHSNTVLNFAGIPTSLLNQERQLETELSAYQNLINAELHKGRDSDNAKINLWQSRVFSLSRSRDSLIRNFEQHYPAYYRLKYDLKMGSTQNLKTFLGPSTGLVEFLITDSVLYTFCLTSGGNQLHKTSITPAFFDHLTLMISLAQQPVQGRSNEGIEDPLSQFHASSHYLFETLLEPSLRAIQVDKLIIVPDGWLGYLPFDLLVTSQTPGINRLDNASYLIQKYTIRRAYSATLLLNESPKGGSVSSPYIGFAPSYEDESAFSFSKVSQYPAFAPLLYNKPEIEAASNLMEGQSFLDARATRHAFASISGKAGILHLAMHTFLNDSLPLYSALVFQPDSTNQDPGFLYGYELYNLSFQAQLVVLSACQSGIGSLQRGEGIMSLARAFRYTGCPNIIMSLWKVEDESTSQIMRTLFEHLKDGMPKDEALRAAKLNYLAKAPSVRRHPFYWGGFVLTGDDRPVVLGYGWKSRMYWAVAGILVIAGFWFFRKRLFPATL